MTTRSRTGERARHRERVNEALDYYAAGLSLRSIAATMGLTVARAQKLVGEGIASLPTQDADELRAGSELRMDRAVEVIRELLDHEDPNVRRGAARDLIQAEAARSRLLGTWQKPEEVA
jgi:hypothetical protein